MNLYFRLIWVLINARLRPSITSESYSNEIHTRVYPNDLDLNLHMNNGRYLTICDLGRMDLFVRSGLASVMIKEKWMPIVADVTMTFIKPLYVFNKIRVVSEVTHWDDKFFYSIHTIYKGDLKVSEGTSKSLVVSKKTGRITPDEVIKVVNKHTGINQEIS